MGRILSLLLIVTSLGPLFAGCTDPGVERGGAGSVPIECQDQDMEATACAYLSSALDIMQGHALLRDSINWYSFRKAAFERAAVAENIPETYPAIEEAMHSLGDNHSFFLPPDEVRMMKSPVANNVPWGDIIDSYTLAASVAHIVLPPFSRLDEASSERYADSVQDIIWQLRHRSPCGWVIDIRWNTGGNMWPMLAGIGPLLGEGEAGAMIFQGAELTWTYKGGKAILGDSVLTEVPDPIEPAIPSGTPVAILTSRSTASSGEAIAIAFRERANTRSFGQPTAGIPTGNSPFELADGARLILTTAQMADRSGRVYHGRIEPDSVIEGNDALEVAAEWLASTVSCRFDGD